MIKQILAIILFLISWQWVDATECVDRIFKEEKINLYLCQNYTNYRETRSLLFKARTKVLNDYIKMKIEKGELADKKFEIQIHDAILTYPHLELTQGKNGYFVALSGFPELSELISIIDYYTRPDWTPYITGDYQKISSETIIWRINHFYEKYTSLNTIAHDPFVIWSENEVRLEYSNDHLKYFIDDTALTVSATSSLPVRMKDRYLLFQSDSIFVFHGKELIQTFRTGDSIPEDYYIYIYDKWVNICHGGEHNWLYSYSYDKNQFYRRKYEKK
jgi:hypothetical protein